MALRAIHCTIPVRYRLERDLYQEEDYMKFQHFHPPVRLTALLLATVLGGTCLTACSSQGADSTADVADTSVTETALSETEAVTETEAATEHVSPTETVTSTLGTRIDVDVTLNRSNDNTYQTALSQFIKEGDVVNSFTFTFYAGDGVSNIGTYKGGCGISVTEDCAAATDTCWYQSDDFSVAADGAYVEVTWNVPSEIQSSIDPTGEVLIGYWWGNTTTVTLKNVSCNYTRTATVPVDATETISVGNTLSYSTESQNSVKVSLAGILQEGYTPQVITFDLSTGGSFGRFVGAFGITTDDWYQSDTVFMTTDAGNMSLTWILPEEVKAKVPSDAEVMLGYWWGDVSDITLQSITVKYSYGSAGQISSNAAAGNVQEGGQQTMGNNAAEIAADIKIGWNLGNTLDCYNVDWKVNDYETAWGNPKTTKAMLDAVKAAGFNAVRIPVSWTDHMSEDGTVDTEWMDRVQEVVDYAMEDGLYTIINVHHDDYTWINPTYSDEAAVTEKYVKLWTQIAERFQDYDTSLLFEGLNEPRVVGSDAEWTGGTAEERDVINHLLQSFVDTVRSSGGKNPDRTLIVTTHAASISESAVNGLVLPEDDNIIVSIHNYAPWKFTTTDYPDDNTFDETGKAELDKEFDYLYDTFVSKGIPVIIGEFGAEDKDNTSVRAEYYSYYISAAAQRGIPCFIWDNGEKDSYGLLDRSNCTWYYNEIIEACFR
jgi:aryl-phospho-beta-D-glucosidase BglC (GH1 family)